MMERNWTVTDTCGNGRFTVLRRGPNSELPDVDMGNEADAQLAAAAPTLHQELANALVLIRLKYGNLDPEEWAWQQEVSELLKSLKVE